MSGITPQLDLRYSAGRHRRQRAERSQLAIVRTGNRDAVEMVRNAGKNHVEALVPLRHGRMLASPFDLFLGWSNGPSGRHFYFRQLRDMKISANVETYDSGLLRQYAAACGRGLARAHAKSGGLAPEISGYIGKSDAVPSALVSYAKAYADQTERDFEAFRRACQSGALPARTDEDFLQDVTV
jgi:hypothetical protein